MNDYLNSEEFRKAYAQHRANEARVIAAQRKADAQRPASGVRQEYSGIKDTEQLSYNNATLPAKPKTQKRKATRKRSSTEYKRTKIKTYRNY